MSVKRGQLVFREAQRLGRIRVAEVLEVKDGKAVRQHDVFEGDADECAKFSQRCFRRIYRAFAMACVGLLMVLGGTVYFLFNYVRDRDWDAGWAETAIQPVGLVIFLVGCALAFREVTLPDIEDEPCEIIDLRPFDRPES